MTMPKGEPYRFVKVYGEAKCVTAKTTFHRIMNEQLDPDPTPEWVARAGGGEAVVDDPWVNAEVRELYAATRRILSDRERRVMAGKRKGFTLEEIGHRIGVTRERVRQIECHATRKIWKLLVRRGWDTATSVGDVEYRRGQALAEFPEACDS